MVWSLWSRPGLFHGANSNERGHMKLFIPQILRLLGIGLFAALLSGALTLAPSLEAQSSVSSSANRITASRAQFAPLGEGVNGDVEAIAVNGTDIYIGGSFILICGNAACDSGNMTANRVAKWNGSAWSMLGNGFDGSVNGLAFNGTDLIAAGSFGEICGNETCDSGNTIVNHIARWNGAAWTGLDNGVSDGVYALKVKGGIVYIGGSFTYICGNAACDSGNSTVNNIAKWDGSTWSGVGNGFSDYVSAIAVSGKKIYAGGHFKEICGNGACDSGNSNAHNIAVWNGTSWSAMGMGLSNDPNVIVTSGSSVYIGGYFSGFCTDDPCFNNITSMNRITRWDGTSFQPVGNGLNFTVFDIVLSNGAVIASGGFDVACGNQDCDSGNVIVNRVAKWDGANWSGFYFGVNDYATALAVTGGELHLGGSFTELCGNETCDSGNTAVNHLATFTVPTCDAKPAQPPLNAPLNAQIISKARPALLWAATECVDTYQAVVKDVVTGAVVAKSDKNSKLKYKAGPLANGTYKWFVKACNVFGCAKSAKYTFIIE